MLAAAAGSLYDTFQSPWAPEQDDAPIQGKQSSAFTQISKKTISFSSLMPIGQGICHLEQPNGEDYPFLVPKVTNGVAVAQPKSTMIKIHENFFLRTLCMPKTIEEQLALCATYEAGKILGDGSYAHVRKVTEINRGNAFALKELIIKSESERERDVRNQTIEELCVLYLNQQERKWIESLNEQQRNIHPIIVTSFGGVNLESKIGETRASLYELCDGTIYDLYKTRDIHPLNEIESITSQLARAAFFLSEQGVIHSDISSRNVAIKRTKSGELTLRLIDFGAFHLTKNAPIDFPCRKEKQLDPYIEIATRSYRPPEFALFRGIEEAYLKHVGVHSNLWPIGCILIELYAQKKSFKEKAFIAADFNQDFEICKGIKLSIGELPEHLWEQSYFSKNPLTLKQKDLLTSKLNMPTRLEIFLAQREVENGKNLVLEELIKGLLKYEERITAECFYKITNNVNQE